MRKLWNAARVHARSRTSRFVGTAAALLLAATSTLAQSSNPIFQPVPENQPAPVGDILQAGCSSCGGGAVPWMAAGPLGCNHCSGPIVGGSCGDGCGGPRCVPGRLGCCEPCHAKTRMGRFFCAMHEALCCPDPCYEPCWIPAANSSFFTESAKPVTQTRFYYDAGINGNGGGDRGEFFWAQVGGRGPAAANNSANIFYHDLVIYTEAAVDRFSVFATAPFRFIDGYNPALKSGPFSDMSVGTKTLLVDSELLLASFQFTTFIPTGVAAFGLGTGHVSLEPALLTALKLFPETYLQASIANRIPIAGTPGAAANVLHYHFSMNHTLAEPVVDTKIIGSLEFGAYSFLNGQVTPTGAAAVDARTTYFALGPGIRIVSCNKLDVGVGMQFAVTNSHFAQQLYRTEFRWRF